MRIDSFAITSSVIKKANVITTKAKDQSVKEVLGYGVDKDGFFTDDFNKKAGIPTDFKIHSDTLKNLVEDNQNSHLAYKPFYEIDIAKSVGNAYKVLSQVVSEDFLNSKEFFSKDDIAKMPQGYIQARSDEIKVNKVLQSTDDYENRHGMTAQNEKHQTHHPLFYSFDNADKTKPNTNVFPPNSTKDPRFSGYFGDYDAAQQNYINSSGEVSKGGLLIGVLKSNPTLIEGESTYKGKLQGYDRRISSADFFAFDKVLSMQVAAKGENGFTSFETNAMPRWLKDYVKLNAYDRPLSQRSGIVGSFAYTKAMFLGGDFLGKNISVDLSDEEKKAQQKQADELMRKIRELMGFEKPKDEIQDVSFDEFLKLAFKLTSFKGIDLKA